MKGFTLVEMMVCVAIFSLLSMAMFSVLTTGTNLYNRDTVSQQLQQDARNGMERLVREIRESASSAITVTDADHDTIVFNTPNETGVRYYLSGTHLLREYPAGTSKILATNMVRLKFTKTGQLLVIDLQVSKEYRGHVYMLPLRENVRLRNE